MNSFDVLSFIRNPDYVSPRSVHDRLYMESSKRNHKSKFNQSASCSTVRFASPGKSVEGRIEDSLMQKLLVSKNNLNKLRVKYQNEELREMRSVPKINDLSRIIAAQSEGKLKDVKNRYIASILSNSRFVKLNESRSDRKVKKAMIKLGSETCEILADMSFDAKREYLNSLRQAVQLRAAVLQPEEPPNLLEMDVIDRGNYWHDSKQKKLELLKKQVEDKGMKMCTFKPVLTPRLKIGARKERSASEKLTYVDLYMKKIREKSESDRR